MTQKPFTVEFQPIGIRLVCTDPITVLDAARQAGINLRNDCGGKGTCGKCVVQVSQGTLSKSTSNEQEVLHKNGFSKDSRLACRAVAEGDVKIMIPEAGSQGAQVLQTEGEDRKVSIDPAVTLQKIHLRLDSQEKYPSITTLLNQQTGVVIEKIPAHISEKLDEYFQSGEETVYAVTSGNSLLNILSEAPDPQVGVAVDIGSTKIAAFLMDLKSGVTIAAKGLPNPQIAYGEDIMSRLQFTEDDEGNSEILQKITVKAINTLIGDLVSSHGKTAEDVMDLCLVGNTAMHHFLVNLPTSSLARAPFTAVTNSEMNIQADDLGIHAMQGAKVNLPAPIAGFVGSDHLAFLLAAGFERENGIRLGIDIGTNTEIALRKGDRIVSCSTASGPAFEGAHIRYGMRAAPGAIEHVHIRDDGIAECSIIAGREAVGICGSGILDAISELRRTGILNQRGRLDKNHPGVQLDDQGLRFYTLYKTDKSEKEITIDQHDIDQVLLAKGAIRAAIEILMDYLEITAAALDEIVIAGAFGSFMDPQHAMNIGLLPKIELNRIHAIGNAAGIGAKMMLLSVDERKKARKLAEKIEHMELNSYSEFSMFFANGIRF